MMQYLLQKMEYITVHTFNCRQEFWKEFQSCCSLACAGKMKSADPGEISLLFPFSTHEYGLMGVKPVL